MIKNTNRNFLQLAQPDEKSVSRWTLREEMLKNSLRHWKRW